MNEDKSKKNYLKLVLLVILALIIITAIGVFFIKPLQALNGASRGSEVGLVGDTYEQVRRSCPTNVELALTCQRSYYAKNNIDDVRTIVVTALESNEYTVKELSKGYDGPDQKAIVAYNAKKNVTLVIIMLDTNNDAYKKANGNVRIEAYAGDVMYRKY